MGQDATPVAPWLAAATAAIEAGAAAPETGAAAGATPEAGTTPAAPVIAAPVPDAAAPAAPRSTVTVTVPKAFKLRIDNATELAIPAGIQEMDPAHAEHWYAKANGVVIYQPAEAQG